MVGLLPRLRNTYACAHLNLFFFFWNISSFSIVILFFLPIRIVNLIVVIIPFPYIKLLV